MTSEVETPPGAPEPAPQPPEEGQPQPAAPEAPAPPDPVAVRMEALERKAEDALVAARRAQSQSSSEFRKAEQRFALVESELERVATATMTEDQAAVWKANRIVQTQQQQVAQTADLRREQEDFTRWSASVLEQEGISGENPRLKQLFETRAAQDPTPSGWRAALGLSIADLRKEEAKSASERARTASEEAKAAKRQTERRTESPIDKGGPSGGNTVTKEDIRNMDEKAFAAHLANLNAQAATRRR